MSKIKCNKCGCVIKIKTVFLERAGCEACGNSIDFTSMDSLSGLKQGLMLFTAVIVAVALFAAMVLLDVNLTELPKLFSQLSVKGFGILLLLACILVLFVGTLERIIGCRIYESERKREEELEKIAEKKRLEDALTAQFECDNE